MAAKKIAKSITPEAEVEQEKVDVKQVIDDRIVEIRTERERMPNRVGLCDRVIEELLDIRRIL